jgi:hypothetical protein
MCRSAANSWPCSTWPTRKRKARRPVHRQRNGLLALTDDKSDAGKLARENGLTRKALEAAIEAVRGGAKVDSPRPKASAKR